MISKSIAHVIIISNIMIYIQSIKSSILLNYVVPLCRNNKKETHITHMFLIEDVVEFQR